MEVDEPASRPAGEAREGSCGLLSAERASRAQMASLALRSAVVASLSSGKEVMAGVRRGTRGSLDWSVATAEVRELSRWRCSAELHEDLHQSKVRAHFYDASAKSSRHPNLP